MSHDSLFSALWHQDEWIGLLAQLHMAELIVVDRRVTEERLVLYQSREKLERHLAFGGEQGHVS